MPSSITAIFHQLSCSIVKYAVGAGHRLARIDARRMLLEAVLCEKEAYAFCSVPRHEDEKTKEVVYEAIHTDIVSAYFPRVLSNLPLFAVIVAYIRRRTR